MVAPFSFIVPINIARFDTCRVHSGSLKTCDRRKWSHLFRTFETFDHLQPSALAGQEVDRKGVLEAWRNQEEGALHEARMC